MAGDMVALWQAAARETGDPQIGLHAAANLPFQMHGPLGYLLASSAILDEGLSLVLRATRACTSTVRR